MNDVQVQKIRNIKICILFFASCWYKDVGSNILSLAHFGHILAISGHQLKIKELCRVFIVAFA